MRAKDTRNIGGEKDNKNKRREKSKKTKEWKTQGALFVPSVGVLKIKIKRGGVVKDNKDRIFFFEHLKYSLPFTNRGRLN